MAEDPISVGFFVGLVIAMGLLSMVMAIVVGITGFGDAIVFYVAWFSLREFVKHDLHSIFGDHDLQIVNVILCCRTLISIPYLIWVSRGGFRQDVFLANFVPSTIASVAGVFVLVKVESKVLQLVLGSFLLVFSIVYAVMMKMGPAKEFVKDITTRLLCELVFAALCSGFMGGLFGIGGPPMMIFMLWSRLDKSITRGCFAPSSLVSNVVKLGILWYGGQIDSSWHQWVVFCTMGLCAYPGIWLGNKLHHKVSVVRFQCVILLLLVMSAVTLMSAPPWVVGTMLGLGFLGVLAERIWSTYYVKRGAEKNVENSTQENNYVLGDEDYDDEPERVIVNEE